MSETITWLYSQLASAGAAAGTVVISGAVFEPLTQLVITADTQFQLETQLPNPMNNLWL